MPYSYMDPLGVVLGAFGYLNSLHDGPAVGCRPGLGIRASGSACDPSASATVAAALPLKGSFEGDIYVYMYTYILYTDIDMDVDSDMAVSAF